MEGNEIDEIVPTPSINLQSNSVIVFPNCKINLGLRILSRRGDGYHDLETVFFPLPIFDALEAIPAVNIKREAAVDFGSSGTTLPIDQLDNICFKAYQLLKEDFPSHISSFNLHLHKEIPIGAGLGGGSADGAFTLQLLNRLFNLDLNTDQLLAYATRLGSDCPFFIINKPCIAKGRGELLEGVSLDLSAYQFFIVNPGIHIHTGKAFARITPGTPTVSIKNIIGLPVKEWKNVLINDFEKTVFQDHPEIKKIKDDLYAAGAVYASMSGSGSTVYGLFKKEDDISMSFPAHFFTRKLVGQF